MKHFRETTRFSIHYFTSTMLRFDSHVHTIFSHDSIVYPHVLVKMVKKRGLNAVTVTDHTSIEAQKYVRYWAKKEGLVFIPGVEYATVEKIDVLCFGITELPRRRLNVMELIDFVNANSGAAVLAHPFDPFYSKCQHGLKFPFHGFEVRSATEIYSNPLTILYLMKRKNISRTGGSDGHIPAVLGRAWTTVPGDTSDDAVQNIRKGLARPGGILAYPHEILYSAISMLTAEYGGYNARLRAAWKEAENRAHQY